MCGRPFQTRQFPVACHLAAPCVVRLPTPHINIFAVVLLLSVRGAAFLRLEETVRFAFERSKPHGVAASVGPDDAAVESKDSLVGQQDTDVGSDRSTGGTGDLDDGPNKSLENVVNSHITVRSNDAEHTPAAAASNSEADSESTTGRDEGRQTSLSSIADERREYPPFHEDAADGSCKKTKKGTAEIAVGMSTDATTLRKQREATERMPPPTEAGEAASRSSPVLGSSHDLSSGAAEVTIGREQGSKKTASGGKTNTNTNAITIRSKTKMASAAKATTGGAKRHGLSSVRKNANKHAGGASDPAGNGRDEESAEGVAAAADGEDEKEGREEGNLEGVVMPVPLPAHVVTNDYCTFWVSPSPAPFLPAYAS